MTGPRMVDLLAATGPFPELVDELKLFGQVVGAWDIKGLWHQRDGSSTSGTGEWHFDWILGGRGIQDVLFATGATPHQFGSTYRCYDKDIEACHLTWMQPASGEFVNLVARQVGDRIVCESVDSGPRRRWTFAEVTSAAFHWLGEVSPDQGRTWFLEQEMWGSRRKT